MKAIMCDIDGTLAFMGDRSPYNWKKVGVDTVNEPIRGIVNKYFDFMPVILVSGRDEVCRPETEKWLKDNSVRYSTLLMRPKGDNRKDSIVKKEIYDNFIRDKYTIEFVLDDRNQVVEMWRGLGLTCLQVAEGDF